MVRKRASNSRILFPWESHGGVRRWIQFGHLRTILGLGALLVTFIAVGARERHQADLRQTQASLQDTVHAVEAFMAEHDGSCPSNIQDIVPFTKRKQITRDAWGRLPSITCPGRHSALGFDVMSDGPDQIPGGLDRVE